MSSFSNIFIRSVKQCVYQWGVCSLLLSFCVLGAVQPALARTKVATSASFSLATPFEVGESATGNYLAALVAGDERDVMAAATFFREAARSDPKNVGLLERAFVASLSNGDMAEAFQLADQLVALDPKNPLTNLVLGIKALKSRRWYEARSYFQKSGSTNDLTTTLLSAWTYAGAKEGRQAIEAIDKILDPHLALLRDYHAGLVADFVGQPDIARKRLKAAYDADKNILRSIQAWANFLIRHSDKDAARAVYQAVDTSTPARRRIISQALVDLDANRPVLALIPSAEAGAAEILYSLGTAMSGQEAEDLASMIYLQLALYLVPNQDIILVSLADLYEHVKQEERAIDVYGSIPETSPFRLNADIQIATLLEVLKKPQEASAQFERLVKANPLDPEIIENYAHFLRNRKEFEPAVAHYSKAITLRGGEKEKNNWMLYYFRGVCYERLKKWPEAEADFRQALSFMPDQPLVLNYLGYSLVDQGLKLDEALGMLRKAVELRSTDGSIVDSLGWAYYRLGQYDEAQKQLERAIELRSSDPTINNHLGDLYWQMGRKLEARFQWNHARDLNPEPEDLKEILKKIESGLPDKPVTPLATPSSSLGKPSVSSSFRGEGG